MYKKLLWGISLWDYKCTTYFIGGGKSGEFLCVFAL